MKKPAAKLTKPKIKKAERYAWFLPMLRARWPDAVAREEQNDCLVRLGLFIEDGAVLCCFGGVIGDCLFYLFTKGGVQIAKGYTMQELIANIPKGE